MVLMYGSIALVWMCCVCKCVCVCSLYCIVCVIHGCM